MAVLFFLLFFSSFFIGIFYLSIIPEMFKNKPIDSSRVYRVESVYFDAFCNSGFAKICNSCPIPLLV